MDNDPDRKNDQSGIGGGDAVGLGTTMAVAMALFGGGGYYLDHRRGEGFLFTLAGITVGLVFCAYEVFMTVRRIQKDDTPGQSDKGKSAGSE